MNSILKWWTVVSIIVATAIITLITGTIQSMIAADTSYLCLTIFAIFICTTIHCGHAHYKFWYYNIPNEKALDIGVLAASTCSKLGLLGTVIGFIMMVLGLHNLNLANPESIHTMVSSMAYGIGVALYTTLVGLVCNMLITIQYFLLERAMCEK